MNALTILARCRSAETDKRRIRQQIERRREAITCISPRMDAEGGGGGGDHDRIGAFVAAVTELERRLAMRERAQSVEAAAACSFLDVLPDNESAVLHQFYVKGNKVSAIARQMGYSESYTRRLKAEGERRLLEIPESSVASALPAWYLERP